MSELTGVRALVTGGAGFIPSHLVDLLVRGGANVTVLGFLVAETLFPNTDPLGRRPPDSGRGIGIAYPAGYRQPVAVHRA